MQHFAQLVQNNIKLPQCYFLFNITERYLVNKNHVYPQFRIIIFMKLFPLNQFEKALYEIKEAQIILVNKTPTEVYLLKSNDFNFFIIINIRQNHAQNQFKPSKLLITSRKQQNRMLIYLKQEISYFKIYACFTISNPQNLFVFFQLQLDDQSFEQSKVSSNHL